VFFPCPLVLRANPKLLGYYRLLYGVSQKDFVQAGQGIFSSMEDAGVISTRADQSSGSSAKLFGTPVGGSSRISLRFR
jgi:hypothetical protein